MLNLIHESHFGVQKCKSLARNIVYWPKMGSEIENFILKCKICEKFRFKNGKEPLLSYEIPNTPWELIFADLFHFGAVNYLVVVDAYSNWIEMFKIDNLSAREVIAKLKILFSHFGVPHKFVSDNVPFNSREFKLFAKEWQFTVATSSPRHPQSNGRAEKAVSICKNLLRRANETNVDIYQLLLQYRNSPLHGLDHSPAQLLLNRRLKSKLPVSGELLKPTIITNVSQSRQKMVDSQKHHFDKSANLLKDFVEGDNVLINKNDGWTPGKVLKVLDEPRSYLVADEKENTYRRNRRLLRKSHNEVEFDRAAGGDDIILDKSRDTESHSEIPCQEPIRPTGDPEIVKTTRSGRVVKKPAWIKDYSVS